MSPKIVVVAGATGNQGGSVVTALVNHGGYVVRGLTRDITSAASQALTARGVEMLQISVMDREGLVEAFKGAYAVFGVTKPFTKDNETDQGKNMVDACRANDVPLFVWTSLPSATKLSNGKVTGISILDDKAAVDQYTQAVGQPTVILHTGSFTENMINQNQLKSTAPGKWEIQFPIAPPDHVQPFSYIKKDVGPAVTAIIDHWEDASWRQRLTKEPIIMCSYNLCGKEMAATLARLTGKEVTYVTLIDTIPEPAKSMFIFFRDYWDYPDPIPPTILTDLGIKFHTFEDYVRDKLVQFMNEKDSA
ncbi:NAD(P)-binding protein [Calocera viscosa TUFC12733]|uniref:NAD(P)-binding protein n=1 Tax=Calocera viscosa (strain TUFC12733) TaxID=1330018 RepID=A0A167KKV8_CALVF|nr:NAD(P)-binding protein [Calocera viscosa TUFC12733]